VPFRLWVGLIVEILVFYDELCWRDKIVVVFERLLVGSFELSADMDRGVECLLCLIWFLIVVFTIFEQWIAVISCVDEYGLCALLVEMICDMVRIFGYRYVVVMVPDQVADFWGFWLVDYDLLAWMLGLDCFDIIVIENVLVAGYHQCVYDVLLGIEEERFGMLVFLPVLSVLESVMGSEGICWIVCCDREEELVDVVRILKCGGAS